MNILKIRFRFQQLGLILATALLLVSNAHAESSEACSVSAPDLLNIAGGEAWTVDTVKLAAKTLVVGGQVRTVNPCLKEKSFAVDIDKNSTKALYSGVATGDVLFAATSIQDNRFQIILSGPATVLSKLYSQWNENRTFEPYIRSKILFRFVTVYTASFEVAAASTLRSLAGNPKCTPGRRGIMLCPEYKGQPYQSIPECLMEKSFSEAYIGSFDSNDRFILPNDLGVAVKSVATNRCSFKNTTGPWLHSVANEIFAQRPENGTDMTVSNLAEITIPVGILW